MDNSDEGRFGGSDERNKTGTAFESELSALVIVAHPDDEALWVGGTMLMYPGWNWRVVSLCRGTDEDRRPRFFRAMERFGGQGSMGELDDGTDQKPLFASVVRKAVSSALEKRNFNLIITHSPFGEYTRHLRHEEIGRAVLHLWQTGALTAEELRMFAYTDSARAHYPKAIEGAHLEVPLPDKVWKNKLAIIQDVYGFTPDSWEAMTTPKKEAFWRFHKPKEALDWQQDYETRMPHEAVLVNTR